MKSQYKKTNKNGFTIVELLVVVLIIGILIAITVTGYSSISAQAKSVSTKSDLANVDKVIRAYHTLNERLPGTQEEMNEVGTWPLNNTMHLSTPWKAGGSDPGKTPRGDYKVMTNKWSDGENYSMTIQYWNYQEKQWEELYWWSHDRFTDGKILTEEVSNAFYDPETLKIPCRAQHVDDCYALDPSVPY